MTESAGLVIENPLLKKVACTAAPGWKPEPPMTRIDMGATDIGLRDMIVSVPGADRRTTLTLVEDPPSCSVRGTAEPPDAPAGTCAFT